MLHLPLRFIRLRLRPPATFDAGSVSRSALRLASWIDCENELLRACRSASFAICSSFSSTADTFVSPGVDTANVIRCQDQTETFLTHRPSADESRHRATIVGHLWLVHGWSQRTKGFNRSLYARLINCGGVTLRSSNGMQLVPTFFNQSQRQRYSETIQYNAELVHTSFILHGSGEYNAVSLIWLWYSDHPPFGHNQLCAKQAPERGFPF